jgi:hypothetical protein
MATETDIVYLAAMIDGEGCIAFARRSDYQPKHRLEVRYDIKIAMTCEKTIDYLRDVLCDIAGDDLVKKTDFPRKDGLRYQWRVTVSSKEGVYRVLSTCLPYMVTKNLEARLCINYLDRARHFVRYKATDYDRRLAELATALRHGCGEARLEAEELLKQVTPSQAVLGFAQAESRTEGVEATMVTPKNNPSQERPAPSLAKPAGEDMVRSRSESPGEGFNGPRTQN